jgi:hypothetical protein
MLLVAASFGDTLREGDMVLDPETDRGATLTWGTAFEVKQLEVTRHRERVSSGRASLHLAGRSGEPMDGNYYLGVKLAIKPADLRDQSLAFDAWTRTPEDLAALYLRLWNGDDCVGSWSTWSTPLSTDGRATIVVTPGSNGEHLRWDPDHVDGEPLRVTHVEWIIGTHEAHTTLSLYVDNLRRVEVIEPVSLQELEQVKPLVLNTPIAAGETLIVPSPATMDAAKRLQAAIAERTGERLVIRSADEIGEPQQHLILVGMQSNHPLIHHLYMHYYTPVDDYLPGDGGYMIETVHDPWSKSFNAVVVGASDDAGMTKAIDALAALLPQDGSPLAPTLKIKLAGGAAERFTWINRPPADDYVAGQLKSGRDGLVSGRHTGVFGQVNTIGERYRLTRHPKYAIVFRDLIKLAYEHYQTDPKTYGGPWGMDSDFRVYGVLAGWDVVEESDALSDADRLEVTRILAKWVTEVAESKGKQAATYRNVRFNHMTFPSLGLYYAGRYFNVYYDAPQARKWLEYADACFDYQMRAFKSHEDCNGYQWLTLGHTMQYALASGNMRWFENGNAAREARYAIASMDNFGYQVPYGDTGSYRCWTSEIPFLQQAAYGFTYGPKPDAELAAACQWTVNVKRDLLGRTDLYECATDIDAPLPPNDLTGVTIAPLEPIWYQNFGGPDSGIPHERTFDKAVFRDSFDRGDPYLLLDGLSGGGHGHYDANSICRITDRDRIWLADNDYYLAQPKFHNGVLVFRDGQSAPLSNITELEAHADLPGVGYTCTTVRDYAGADWQRNLVFGDGQWFLVLDRMTAKQAGDFSFRTVWQLVGDVTDQPDGLIAEQKGERFVVRTIDGFNQRRHDDAHLGRNWGGYPYADPVVRFYHQIADVALSGGEQVIIPTLLFAERDGMPADTRLRQVADGVFVIGESTVVAVASPDKPISVGGLQTDARLCVLLGDQLTVVDATFVFAGDVRRRFPQPTTQQFTWRNDAIASMAAIPFAVSADSGEQLPALDVAWKRTQQLERFALTGNASTPGAVDVGMTLAADPAPLERNVFGSGPNTTDAMFDGQLDTAGVCTQWGTDDVVTLTLDFGAPAHIDEIEWHQWWASSSSKGRKYMLGRARFELSNDGFVNDVRDGGEFIDDEDHTSWGSPVRYQHAINATAAQVRITITPRDDTGVYIAELYAWGQLPDGISADLADMPQHPVHAIATGDGEVTLVVADGGGFLTAFNRQQEQLWQREFGSALRVALIEDIDGDGEPEILTGGDGATLHCLAAQGEPLWSQPIATYKHAAKIHVLFTAKLPETTIIAGADNWRYYAFDAQGNERWWQESVHRSTAGAAADLNGDGIDEVICGTEYYWWPVVDADNNRLWQFRAQGGPGVNVVDTIALDTGRAVLFGAQAGALHVVDPAGKEMWQFHTGDEITDVVVSDIDADGDDEIVASSMNFNVFAFERDGSRLWRTDLSAPVMKLTRWGYRLLAGDDQGRVVMMSLDGEPLAQHVGRSAITALQPAGDVCYIATNGGDMVAIKAVR